MHLKSGSYGLVKESSLPAQKKLLGEGVGAGISFLPRLKTAISKLTWHFL